MSTYTLADYDAQDIRRYHTDGMEHVVGSVTEGDVVEHPFGVYVRVICNLTTTPGADSRLYADRSTAGQVTFTDSANTGDTVDFHIFGF